MVTVRLVGEQETPYDGQPLTRGADTAKFLQGHLKDLDREHFVVLMLNARNRLISMTTVSIGSLDFTLVEPREVFKAAVLQNARAIVAAHNHPSGDPTPSDDDITITKRLADAGRLLGIYLMDHVIIAPNGSFISLRESAPGLF